jgi:hypothetical protein
MKSAFDLDELKASWSDWNTQLKQQPELEPMVLQEILAQKAQHRLHRLIRLESWGAIFSLLFFVGMCWAWPRADHWSLQLALLIVQLIMLGSAVLGWQLVRRARRINVLEDSHTLTVAKFTRFKGLLRFYKYFSLGVYAILPLLIPAMVQLFRDSADPLPARVWWMIPISALILALVWWGIYRFYRQQLRTIRNGIDK